LVTNDPSDAALALAAQQGDLSALGVLIGRYRSLAQSIAAGFTGVFLERDDFIQEAMLALLSAVYTFTPDKNASFRTYAGVCIQNRLRSAVKAQAAKKHQPLNSYVPLEEIDLPGGTDPEGQMIRQEEAAALTRFFERELSSLEKRVLLYRLGGLSYSEISKRLHITEKSIDNALQRVRTKLKRRLDS
jgi:RNA polymerase sporulation-specific sigma factor